MQIVWRRVASLLYLNIDICFIMVVISFTWFFLFEAEESSVCLWQFFFHTTAFLFFQNGNKIAGWTTFHSGLYRGRFIFLLSLFPSLYSSLAMLANHLSSPHFTVCHSARPLMQLLQPSSMWMLYLYLSMQGDSAQQPQLKCPVGVSRSVRYVEVYFRAGSWSSKHTTDWEVRDYRQDFSHTCSNLPVPHQGQNQCSGLWHWDLSTDNTLRIYASSCFPLCGSAKITFIFDHYRERFIYLLLCQSLESAKGSATLYLRVHNASLS